MSNSPRRRPSPVSQVALLAMLPLGLLAGCNTLPDSGPVEAGVLNAAKKPETNPLGFRIVKLTPPVVGAVGASSGTMLSSLAGRMGSRGQNDRIGAGDVLQVSIFELGSGLFAGGGGGLSSGASNPLTGGPGPNASVTSENLPPIVVDAGGMVDVPYVGRLAASGRSTTQLAGAIQAGLKGQSQNPQVLVRIATDIANAVIVSGDVKKPGREPLTLAQERLLDMVAIAGGPVHAPEDTIVQVTRDGRTGHIPLATLQDDPDQNIVLQPHDRIQVSYRPSTFTVFGASKVSEVPFNTPQLSMAEALARIGGPLDDRADPNAVFLFRFEKPSAARRLGLPLRPDGGPIPVIYQLDMMDPTSYFLAQKFAMDDKDLVYIANAKTNKFYKFFSLISTIVGPGLTAAYLTKD